MRRILIGLFASVLFLACNNPESVKPILNEGSAGNELNKSQIFVLNEGNFGNGVASLSRVESTDTSFRVENDVYQRVNNEYLGNIAQAISRVGEEYWVVINNSQKIIITDLELNKTGEINGLTSPRYLAVSDSKVYVSDLYADSLHVIDRFTKQVQKRIYTGNWNEEILVNRDELWVTNAEKSTVNVYSTLDESFLAEVELVKQPLSMKVDDSGNIWVICNGGLLTREEEPYLFKINAGTKQKTDSLNLFSLDGLPSRLSIHGDYVYFLCKDIYRYGKGELEKVVDAGSKNIYALHVSNEYIYYTNAKDYVRRGDLVRVTKDEPSIFQTVKVGVIPGFIFEP